MFHLAGLQATHLPQKLPATARKANLKQGFYSGRLDRFHLAGLQATHPLQKSFKKPAVGEGVKYPLPSCRFSTMGPPVHGMGFHLAGLKGHTPTPETASKLSPP